MTKPEQKTGNVACLAGAILPSVTAGTLENLGLSSSVLSTGKMPVGRVRPEA